MHNQVAWLTIAAAIIGLVIKVVKSTSLPIPSKALPWIAFVLGVISSVVQYMLVPGTTWQQAIVQAIGAAALPVLGQEAVGQHVEAAMARKKEEDSQ